MRVVTVIPCDVVLIPGRCPECEHGAHTVAMCRCGCVRAHWERVVAFGLDAYRRKPCAQ